MVTPGRQIRLRQLVPTLPGLTLSEDPADFDAVMDFDACEAVKDKLADRQVHRCTLSDGNVYYLKRVFRTPFLDAVKARYSSGEWHSRPGREWDALRRLQEIGVAAPEPVACAEEYRNGLVRRAYIILKEAPVSGSLESHFLSDSCEFDHQSIKLLIAQALISLKRMHDHGVNHRDFYLGHLFLSHRNEVWVLDLDRADVRDEMPIRWRIKDLAALHFSIPERLLSTRERLSILRHNYLENSLSSERRFLEAIEKKAQTIRKHVERKVARRAPNFHVNE